MRTTHTPPVTITCEAWKPEERITFRTTKTAGDTQWIDSRSLTTVIDPSAKDNMRFDMDTDLLMTATIAKMAMTWTLYQDQVDNKGNVIYDDQGNVQQVPVPWLTDENERLQLIASWHDDDVKYIYGKLDPSIPTPPTQQEQKDFLTSATAPTLENSEQANPSQTN